jgi:hypothetical protein
MTTTNAQGGYQFISLQSGIYRLEFSDPQEQYGTQFYVDAYFVDDATTVNVNGNNVSGIDMTLGGAGSISVTLQNSPAITTTAYNVTNVTLYRQNASGAWTLYRQVSPWPGENGVLFDTLPTGNYRLCAEGRNYYSYDYSPAVECFDNVRPEAIGQLASNASDIPVQAGVETEVAILLGDTPQLEGYILNRRDQPLANIAVAIFPLGGYPQQIVKTNSDGYYSFAFIPEGTYHLGFNVQYYDMNGYLPVYYPHESSFSNAGTLLIDATTRFSITKHLSRSSTLHGKVTLPGGVPLSWAYITLFRQDEDGAWNYPSLII